MKFKNKSVAFLTFFIMGGFLSTSVESVVDRPEAELAKPAEEAYASEDVSDLNRGYFGLKIRKNSPAAYVGTAKDLQRKLLRLGATSYISLKTSDPQAHEILRTAAGEEMDFTGETLFKSEKAPFELLQAGASGALISMKAFPVTSYLNLTAVADSDNTVSSGDFW
ncbi:MAG: hypothetical protein JSS34_02270 [Proteobacteria bacterium]|nr:hypothetical protein [Pseudomonadota bacterium]